MLEMRIPELKTSGSREKGRNLRNVSYFKALKYQGLPNVYQLSDCKWLGCGINLGITMLTGKWFGCRFNITIIRHVLYISTG